MAFLNWFIDPVKNHYADFSGRVSRKAYWLFVLIFAILMIVISVLEELIGIGFISALFYLALLVPCLALTTRRLHDTGLSGWWQLLNLVPIIGWIIVIILLIRKGNEGENKYGLDSTAVAVG